MAGIRDVFKFLPGLFHIFYQAADRFLFIVVPFKVNSNVLFCIEVNFESVFCLHDFNEVLGVLFVDIFDSKIVNNKCEGDISGDVFE